jgi:ribonuclease Z
LSFAPRTFKIATTRKRAPFIMHSRLYSLPRQGFFLGVLLLALPGFALAQLPAGGLSGDAMLRTMKARRAVRDATAQALNRKDALTVVLVGTGCPLPSDRAQASTAVFAGGQFLLFDCGDGASQSIDALQLPIEQLDAVFVTHYHSDHFADLGEIIDRSWLLGRREVLDVHGPTGITELVDGFKQAYRLEQGYRTAHHGPEIMPPASAGAQARPFEAETSGAPVVIYDKMGVVVKAFAVNHPPVHPAVGYRVEYGGKVVVISGDTTATDSLVEQSRDADLLCAEVMNMALVEQMEKANEEIGNHSLAHILNDIRKYHIDVRQLGELAQQAKVKRLALTHMIPPVPKAAAAFVFKGPVSQPYRGEVIVGEDGTKIVLELE